MWGIKKCSIIQRTVISLCCVFAFLFLAVAPVYADTVEQDGLTIETTFDKDSYKSGQKANVTVSVTNTNDYDVTDVTVTYSLPDNFTLTTGETTQTIETLAAGESTSFTVTAKVTEDTSAEIVDESAVGSKAFGLTGILIIVAVVVVVIIILAVVLVRRKGSKGGNSDDDSSDDKKDKKNKKGPSAPITALVLLLAGGTILGSAALAQGITEVYAAEGSVDYLSRNRVTVHDPSIVKDPDTGEYYIFGSHLAFAKTSDLISWTYVTNNLTYDYSNVFSIPASWSLEGSTDGSYNVSGNMWAPDVIWNESMQKWCMYMSINGDNWCSSICLLTSDSLDGDWEYQGIVVYSGMNNSATSVDASLTDVYDVLGENADLSAYSTTDKSCINAIDPCVKYDEDGNLYMVYGSWSAGIYMLQLDPETGFRDTSVTYTTETNVSDAYLGTKIAGGYYCSGEAPYIIYADGYYYLFISYGGLEATGGYQMRVYRSENIDGPYVDQNGNSAIRTSYEQTLSTNYGVKLFGSYDMSGLDVVNVAQGHNSALVDDDGKIYLVYHTRYQSSDGTNETHNVRVHQLFINEDGWLVAAPYEYTGETLSEDGYSVDEVVGTYDYIYHTPEAYYSVSGSLQIGIMGDETSTTSTASIEAETVVSGRKAVVDIDVTYTREGSARVTLNADGTVTGSATGTWEFTDGANVVMVLDGVTYKGVFLKQQDESSDNLMHMTFTILGDNVTVWGVSRDEVD